MCVYTMNGIFTLHTSYWRVDRTEKIWPDMTFYSLRFGVNCWARIEHIRKNKTPVSRTQIISGFGAGSLLQMQLWLSDNCIRCLCMYYVLFCVHERHGLRSYVTWASSFMATLSTIEWLVAAGLRISSTGSLVSFHPAQDIFPSESSSCHWKKATTPCRERRTIYVRRLRTESAVGKDEYLRLQGAATFFRESRNFEWLLAETRMFFH